VAEFFLAKSKFWALNGYNSSTDASIYRPAIVHHRVGGGSPAEKKWFSSNWKLGKYSKFTLPTSLASESGTLEFYRTLFVMFLQQRAWT